MIDMYIQSYVRVTTQSWGSNSEAREQTVCRGDISRFREMQLYCGRCQCIDIVV